MIAGMERWCFTAQEVVEKMLVGIPVSQVLSSGRSNNEKFRFCIDTKTGTPGLIIFREIPVEK